MSDLKAVAQVRAAVQQYIDGTVNGDADMIAAVFHPQAVMTGYFGPDLLCGSPEPFLEAVRANPAPMDTGGYEAQIQGIDVAGNVASAWIAENGLMGSEFVDFFHLVKTDEKWLIVAKTFHAGPR